MGMPDPTLRRLAGNLDARAEVHEAAAANWEPKEIPPGWSVERYVHAVIAEEFRALAADLRAGVI